MSPARAVFAFVLLAGSGWATAAVAPADVAVGADAAVQARARYEQVRERLAASPYGRPLALDSRELPRELQGDAYAVISQPFAKVEGALAPIANWCDLLMLPFNTKHCVTSAGRGGSRLGLFVGRKNDTPIADAFRLDFDYAVTARSRDYLQIVLKCADGPLGTRDYRIVLELSPVDEGRTFLHLAYSYGYGAVSRIAMQAYLATIGASKVGFSQEGGGLVRGMRGVMERNTMRYYLAVDAYLASLDAPPGTRVAKRLNDWFSEVERYPRQLGEDINRAQYVAMTQRELVRVASAATAEAGAGS